MTQSTTKHGAPDTNPKLDPTQTNTFFEMDQRKNDFLATLAHELRNPLGPIKNGLQLLAFMKLDRQAEVVCAMMARQVEQIVHLVDDLLDISRICSGKVLLDKQICRISVVIDAATEQSSNLLLENGMKLTVSDSSDAACVCGDPCRLTQVVCNLLNNSAKYGKVGGNVALKVDRLNDFVRIQVQDDGVGIASERLNDIFTMYSQIESASGQVSSGLGIGLALVRTLVELHDGTVHAESEGPNSGSTFTIRLPLAKRLLPVETPSILVSPHSARCFHVLIVDDRQAIRYVTQQLLEKLGHEVRTAKNGVDALEMIDESKPDIVFSDITMPIMGGHKLASRIREQAILNSIYLVALTGYGQSSDREMAFEAGFDRHLTKPVDFEQLRTLFDELDSAKQETV